MINLRSILRQFLLGFTSACIISCNNDSGEVTMPSAVDTQPTEVKIVPGVKPPAATGTRLFGEAFALVKMYESSWDLVNDSIASWPKDVFDYFIATKRKSEPDYPYIAKGDFNGDGKDDLVALVKNNSTNQFMLLIAEDMASPTPQYRTWKEDIDLCAISLYPRKQGDKLTPKGDGINVEFYERASFVIYWDGRSYKRSYTAD